MQYKEGLPIMIVGILIVKTSSMKPMKTSFAARQRCVGSNPYTSGIQIRILSVPS